MALPKLNRTMNLSNPITIVIADDHELVRTGFKKILQDTYSNNIHFVAEAKNGRELIEKVDQYQPQLVLTDLQMPEINGIQACREIKQRHPWINVVAFSMFTDTEHIMGMIRAGANGYVAKSSPADEIIEGIMIASTGKPFYCSTISEKLYGKVTTVLEAGLKAKQIKFSRQEIKVMQLICRQLSSKEIAEEMKLAVRSVECHRYHIQEKIGARNMVGVALYALMSGLVDVRECRLQNSR